MRLMLLLWWVGGVAVAAPGDKGVIGIRFLEQPEGLVITDVIDGSGADAAGLTVGDRVVAVGEKAIEGDASWAPGAIRGPVGTSVSLTLEGPFASGERVVDVARGRGARSAKKEKVSSQVARFSAAMRAGKAGAAGKAAAALVASDFDGQDPANTVRFPLFRASMAEPRAARSALKALSQVTDAGPDYAASLGHAYAELGDDKAAVNWLERAAKAWPDDIQSAQGSADIGGQAAAQRQLVKSQWAVGKRDEAIQRVRNLARITEINGLLGTVGMAHPAPRQKWRALLPPVSDFDTTLSDGSTWRLSAYKGKPVALVFWASWCGPCKEEMPALARVWDERSDDLGAEILGISVDTETQAPKADRLLRKWKVGFSTTRNQSLQQRFDVSGLPSVRVVGPSGSLRYSSRGYSKKSVEELIEKLEELVLEEKSGGKGEGLPIGAAWSAGSAELRGFAAVSHVAGLAAKDGNVGVGIIGALPMGLPIEDGAAQGGVEVEEGGEHQGAGLVAWLDGPVSTSSGRPWLRAAEPDGDKRWFITLDGSVRDMVSDGTHLWVALEKGVVVLDKTGALVKRLDLNLMDLAVSHTGGIWGVDGQYRVHIDGSGVINRAPAPGSNCVAEDGSWAGKNIVALKSARVGVGGKRRLIGVKTDGTIVGLDGELKPALFIHMDTKRPPKIAATDIDGDGQDEILVSVRNRGVATVALELP